ncbi:MAG: TM0106 family RecB-like putative nuclease [Nitrospira sp.]|nr:TM0106 family RecB-like putative nuclease [Nitrospira sp.]MDH4343464.1 TM0106 family RecB-like putative nuclease [Nitrospira sp.]MDH5336972.1 TM0106 family RecB-like putative nuclease [Nitrospira sp.]
MSDYFACRYKVAINQGLVSGQKAVPAENLDYEVEYRGRAIAMVLEKYPAFKKTDRLELAIGPHQKQESVVGQIVLTVDNLQCHLDGLEVLKKTPRSRSTYAPILCAKFLATPSKHEKRRLAFSAILIEKLLGSLPTIGRIVHGDTFKFTKVHLKKEIQEVSDAIQGIQAIDRSVDCQSYFRLNRHCTECQYSVFCKEKARRIDHLSLIGGIGEKEIKDLNAKGIFTVTQLAHTFRPRRTASNNTTVKHNHALRAKAILDDKIYVVQCGMLPTAKAYVYLDVEGMPDLDFYYLVGLVVVTNGKKQYHQFWADTWHDQEQVWSAFLGVIRSLDEFVLFHYGKYDSQYLSEMERRYGCESTTSEQLRKSAMNVLSLIYGKIYFPTYSNTLKEIAAFTEFKWTEAKASGQQSIIWRKRWELTHKDEDKEVLLQYNRDDCTALEKVVSVLHGIGNQDEGSLSKVTSVEEIKLTSTYKFGTTDYCVPEFDYINKCAYFDYQRNKISLSRESRNRIFKAVRHQRQRRTYRVNKTVVLRPPTRCISCGSDSLYKHGRYKKTVLDLKFSTFGVRRHVVRYVATRMRCRSCKKVFLSDMFLKIRSRYGHDFSSWVIYQHVAMRQSLKKVAEVLDGLFGYSVSMGSLAHIKRAMANKYASTYQLLVRRIKNGDLVHVDETAVSIKGNKAYIWVFTNHDEVVYFYSDSREGQLLKDVLHKFKGVLISDFYSAYDSIDCRQQKCLIHL